MPLVSDLMQVGFSARQAEALGDTFATVTATGPGFANATAITDSIIYINNTSGLTPSLKLPKIDASKSKQHKFGNGTGTTVRIYVADSTIEGFKIFGLATSGAGYVELAGQQWMLITKVAADFWGAFTYQ